jgi:aspartate kinase
MRVVVHKYGGSSLATPENIKAIAQKVVSQRRQGFEVAVVVSAMGDTTNSLLELARATSPDPSRRELDVLLTAGERISMALLSMAISDAGKSAVSLTGPQAGIVTTDAYNRARIIEVRPHRVRDELMRGRVPVVAGFQGLSYNGEITTLGRGGSDTSAVALASALGAERCDIYSDVDGIYSSDPRLVPQACRLDEVGYDEMFEMARYGARVLNVDAVDFARRSKLEIRARSTFSEHPGTVVRERLTSGDRVVGIAVHDDLIRLRLRDHKLMASLREFLEQSEVLHAGTDEVLVGGENIPDRAALRRSLLREFRDQVECSSGLGLVSVIGSGVGRSQDNAARAQAVLARRGLSARTVFTGPLSLTSVIEGSAVQPANLVLHDEFIARAVPA